MHIGGCNECERMLMTHANGRAAFYPDIYHRHAYMHACSRAPLKAICLNLHACMRKGCADRGVVSGRVPDIYVAAAHAAATARRTHRTASGRHTPEQTGRHQPAQQPAVASRMAGSMQARRKSRAQAAAAPRVTKTSTKIGWKRPAPRRTACPVASLACASWRCCRAAT
eukprot:361887-Chlamydomonas_euryale.AAC.2